MSEKSRQYSAFTVGSLGVYEFLRMPYGSCNAPATFQRLMQNCLGELNLTYTLVYLDDVIVYSKMEQDHLRLLQAVFEQFHEHGLKLKPSKCSFLRKQITFLGHEISADGMMPGNLNLKGIAEMAPLANYTEVRHFLRMTGFFRRFIKNYARIAKPLNDILEGEASKLKSEAITLPLDAFEKLKMYCMMAPVLAFADFEKEFQLETDASFEGLGAILSQKQLDTKWHPIAFGSRELKGGEAKYHSSKLEFLALKWAIMEQFWEYLQYRPFTVLMDNNPLTYILTMPNLYALDHRWVAALAGYNMTIKYLKGSDNKVADALSRIKARLDPDTVTELLNHMKAGAPAWAETHNIRIIEEEERTDQEVILRTVQLARQDKKFRNLCTENWCQAQLMDPVIPHVLDWLCLPRNNRVKLKDFLRGKASEADCRAYGSGEKDFEKRDHLLFINTTPPRNVSTIPVFVVPVNRRQVAIDMCHRNARHQGRDRTLNLMKGQFWWPGMATALCLAMQNCGRCKQFEAKSQLPGMEPILCTQPMELVHVDYKGMEVTLAAKEKPAVKNVLVVVDHFNRYVQAFVTKNHTARTTVRVLNNNFFSVFGFPQKLLSDQGTEFTGDVIAVMCKLLGIEKIRTTLYHPQTNRSAERVHQTLQRMISKLDPEKRRKGPEHIGSVLIAYKATRSQVSGYSPYFLMFGRRPRLPVDLLFPTVNN